MVFATPPSPPSAALESTPGAASRDTPLAGAMSVAAADPSLGSTALECVLAPSPAQAAAECAEPSDAAVDAERLADDIAELASRIQAATYELLVLIRRFDEQGGWSGFVSCAHWLNWRTGLALGAAREKVRVARALGALPLLSEAMREGRISYSKVRAITRVATPENERRLRDFALCAPASYVERMTRAWRVVDRQAEADDERRRHEGRRLSTWVDDTDGMVVIRGRLTPEVGAVVRRALEAAVDRQRSEEPAAADGGPETTFGQRQADALGLIAESALAAELDRGAAGDRYQVVLHVDADTLRAAPAAVDAGDVPAETPPAGAAPAAVDAGDVPAETPPTPPAGAAPAAVDAGDVPAETPPTPPAGAAPAAVDAGDVPAETRSHGHAALEDADGLRVSAETSRRIACEASAVVMRHAADGAILDVGRKTRTIPPALGRALRARDRGCRFPGCTARRCDAHHVRHWADGGATRLDNLVLLCRRHHRAVHEEGFRVEVDPGGAVAFRWPDGRPFPAAPAAPRWTGPALAPTDLRLDAAGIAIGPATATPHWHGERLDLRYAIDVLWTPRAG